MTIRILIIEDDPGLQQMLALHFEDRGHQVRAAADIAEGEHLAQAAAFDLILLDQQLPDGAGIDLLPRLLTASPDTNIVMMTGQHDLELAIRAIKAGAADFVHKPLKSATLQATVDKVLALNHREPGPIEGTARPAPGEMIGRSQAMLEISKQIALCANNAATVMITGESGTGKEVVARLIHQHSGNCGPFIAINCAAIVESLLESELFGHDKGAFTGADRSKPGKFELAANGTLFLDEIAELAPSLQAKLLRALQERTVERVGGTTSISVSARIIAATHRDLFARANDGQFREDLAYRLNVINIELPPLRNRREDIPLLAAALLQKTANRDGRQVPALSHNAIDKLSAYDWPGNVRELENVLVQAAILSRNGQVTAQHIRFRQSPEASTIRPEPAENAPAALRSLDEIEASHIQLVLEHTGGHKGRSCEVLGISRPALDRKIQKYQLRLPSRD